MLFVITRLTHLASIHALSKENFTMAKRTLFFLNTTCSVESYGVVIVFHFSLLPLLQIVHV